MKRESDIPDLLRDWLLEKYGQDAYDAYVHGVLHLSSSENSDDIFMERPEEWILRSFGWNHPKRQSTGIHWHALHKDWVNYISSL